MLMLFSVSSVHSPKFFDWSGVFHFFECKAEKKNFTRQKKKVNAISVPLFYIAYFIAYIAAI